MARKATQAIKVHVLLTGGTFLSKPQGKKGGLAPVKSMKEFTNTRKILEAQLHSLNVVITWKWVMAKDSALMEKTDWYVMHRAIHDAFAEGADHVIVVHGTDTMEYSAGAMRYLFTSGDHAGNALPGFVVFSGAMRSVFEPGSDAPANFQDSVLACIWAHQHGLGDVAVCFGRKLIPAVRVVKEHPQAFAAFRAPALEASGLDYFDAKGIHGNPDRYKRKVAWASPEYVEKTLPGGVIIMEVEPGLEATELVPIVRLKTTRVLILATPGDGNLSKAFHEVLRVAKKLDKPVIVVSMFQGQMVRGDDYAVGREAVELGAIPGLDTTHVSASLKARLLLLFWSKRLGSRVEFFRKVFATSLVREVTVVSDAA